MRFLLTAALLVATATYGWMHPPANLALGRGALRAVPATFGPWSGADLSFEDAVVEELRADDLLLRRYSNGTDAVWLCLVYHQNRRYGAHDPQLCYDSQGWLVEPPTHVTIADSTGAPLDVNAFVARRRDQVRLVWYWWTTQGLATSDAGAFRRRMALAGALENRSWGAFVRVETIVADGDMAGARARMADFSGRVASGLPAVFAAARNPK